MALKKMFLSVGAMKAGTTFLYSALKDHPDLYFTPEKELHFFAHVNGIKGSLYKPLIPSPKDEVRRLFLKKNEILSKDFRIHRMRTVLKNRYQNVKDAQKIYDAMYWYSDKYLAEPIDEQWITSIFENVGDRYACDFSNYNALLDVSSWDYVKSICDELKVIYVIRHPVDRIWSHIKFHFVQSGRGSELDNLSRSDIRNLLKNADISSHARYAHIIENLQNKLAPSQLKIICFEELISEFSKSMFSLEEFLGVQHLNYDKIDPNRRVNAGKKMDIPSHILQEIRSSVGLELDKLSELKIPFPKNYYQ